MKPLSVIRIHDNEQSLRDEHDYHYVGRIELTRTEYEALADGKWLALNILDEYVVGLLLDSNWAKILRVTEWEDD